MLFCSVCKMQMTNRKNGRSLAWLALLKFVMVYGEYTENWCFRDRAPLSTLVYPGRILISHPKIPKKNRSVRIQS